MVLGIGAKQEGWKERLARLESRFDHNDPQEKERIIETFYKEVSNSLTLNNLENTQIRITTSVGSWTIDPVKLAADGKVKFLPYKDSFGGAIRVSESGKITIFGRKEDEKVSVELVDKVETTTAVKTEIANEKSNTPKPNIDPKEQLPKTPEKIQDIKVGQVYKNNNAKQDMTVSSIGSGYIVLSGGTFTNYTISMSDFLDGFKPNENLGGESLWELVKDAETPTEGKSENETPKPTIKPPSEPIPTFDVEKSAEMVKSLNEVYKEMLDIYIDTTKTNEERYDAIKEIDLEN